MDQTAAAPARTRALIYDGRVGELYSIFLLNLLFTILTLGIFRFWAITRYRRYFWSHTRFQGERFEYTGTGGELFVGYLLAGLVLIGGAVVAVALGAALAIAWKPLAIIPMLLFYVAIVVLMAGAVFSAQRYRLSRTLWCGIRGGMTGSMARYGMRSVLYTILAVVTLLQTVPWMQVRLAELRINASSFGSARFSLHGRARRLYLPFVLTLLASIVLFGGLAGVAYAVLQAVAPGFPKTSTPSPAALQLAGWIAIATLMLVNLLLAIVSCWYTAAFERHVVGNTSVGPVRLASSMTGGGLCGLVLGNLIIATLTLGFGYPMLLQRNMRFMASTLWVEGVVDTETLAQSTYEAPRFGEGMYQQLDATGWM